VPILQGNDQNEGTIFTLGVTTNAELGLLINSTLHGVVTVNEVASVYPNLTGNALAAQFVRDFTYLWYVCELCSGIDTRIDDVIHSPASLHVNAYQAAGLSTIYRYMYGAVFQSIAFIHSNRICQG
jgi:hypothetical protein